MVSSTRQAIACLLFIFGVAVAAHAQTAPVKEPVSTVKEPTSTVSGRVTFKDKPAPGVGVGLRVHDASRVQHVSYRAVTDLNGEYRITNLPARTYLVAISAPGFITVDEFGIEKALIVNKGETIENLDFTLARGGVITGKVVDAEGRPLVEQQVNLVPESWRFHSVYGVLNLRTDDRGIYRAFGLPPGKYRVAAGDPDHDSFRARYGQASYNQTFHPNVTDQAQATVIEVSEGSEATNVDIVLGRTANTYNASGRVLDEAGQPVPNVQYVVTHFRDANSTSSLSSGAVTNSRGEFRLERLVPGQYAVSVRAEGNVDWRTDPVRFEIVDQDVTGLVVTSKRAASLSGVLIIEGADEKAAREILAKTNVSASVSGLVEERGGWGNWTRPAPDGSFRINGLQAGTATLHVSSMTSPRLQLLRVERDGMVQPRSFEIREREQVTGIRVYAMLPNASIRGTVAFQNGTLPANARFSVWITRRDVGPDGTGYPADASPQIDSRGQFVIDGLMPGTYELHVSLFSLDRRRDLPNKTQQVVVTSGAVTNVVVTLDLSSLNTRP